MGSACCKGRQVADSVDVSSRVISTDQHPLGKSVPIAHQKQYVAFENEEDDIDVFLAPTPNLSIHVSEARGRRVHARRDAFSFPSG
jgi:hypothetical protein